MAKRKQTIPTTEELPGHLAFRIDGPTNARFERVIKASRRSKTSIVLECMERWLPELEKRYEGFEAA